MAVRTVAPSAEIAEILDSPEVAGLIAEVDALRWTGRKGYGARVLIGACLVKSLYAIPTWTRVTALIGEHAALQASIGGAPSEWACYRFARKLREHKPLLDACLARIAESLRESMPDYGIDVAVDASDMPAYGNGQRLLSRNGPERERYSDPEASWGHRSAISTRRGGGFYGWKLHAAVCVRTDLPLAWHIETARTHESSQAGKVLDAVRDRGFMPTTVSLDKGYDVTPVYEACERVGALPIIPLRQTPGVKRGDHLAPECEHGRWTFAGADFKRGATKWRCPTGECSPKSVWVKASRLHPLIPRETTVGVS